MTLPLRLAGLALLLVALAGTVATGQTELRWKFKPGEATKYVINQKVNMEMTTGDRTVKTDSVYDMYLSWKVKDVDAEGNAQLEQTIDRLVFKLNIPGLDAMTFDSREEKDPEGLIGRSLGPVLRKMVGAPLQVKMSPRGEMLEFKLPEALDEALKNQPQNNAGMLSKDALVQMLTQSSAAFPEKAVTNGSTWKQTVESKVPQLGTQTATLNYTYLGSDNNVEKIDVKTTMTLEAEEGAAAQGKITAQDSKGTILFDSAAGKMVSSSIHQQMEMQVTLGQITVTNKMTTVSEMKLAE